MAGLWLDTTNDGNLAYNVQAGDCKKCPAGRFSSTPAGVYTMQENFNVQTRIGEHSVYCLGCTAGKYSTIEAGDHGSVCVDCPEGKFSPATGVSSLQGCALCPSGYYGQHMG